MVCSPTGRVRMEPSLVEMKGQRKLFHALMNTKIATAARMGRESGRMIWVKIRIRLAPSITAASSSSRGIWSKNFLSTNTMAGWMTCGRMMAHDVSIMCSATIW